MKHLICALIICLSVQAMGQNGEILAKPKVDERVELLSIVFRLAECQEYSARRFPKYVESIEQHFGPYRDHEIIQYVKKTLRPHGIGYDAVMCMAISITDHFPFEPLVPFSDEIPEARWGKKRASTFLKLLNDFYQVAQCKQFFEDNKNLYTTASQSFHEVYSALDVQWYSEFYGEKPKGEFRIINGLGNGGANYGPHITVNDKEIVYAIMGTWSVDSLGAPMYRVDDYFPVLLHEFNHSFINHLVKLYSAELVKSGKKIYPPLEERMRAMAYGNWEVMFAEAIVRAAVIKYLKDHHHEQSLIDSRLNNEINIGFLWTAELVEELERYDRNRDQFPTLESFMPELVKFFEGIAANINALEEAVQKRRPKVVAFGPFENGSQEVDPRLQRIEITFDKAMKGSGNSISYGAKGKKAFPKISEAVYSEDKKSVSIALQLEPNKRYQFVLTRRSFTSEDGFGISDYEVNFRTKN
jgi:hypothetical protein